jgi:hypothetical protein
MMKYVLALSIILLHQSRALRYLSSPLLLQLESAFHLSLVSFWLNVLLFQFPMVIGEALDATVRYKGVGCHLGPEGKGVSPGEEGEGGPGPPDKEQDKQSSPSKEGGNMEWEEEVKRSQA